MGKRLLLQNAAHFRSFFATLWVIFIHHILQKRPFKIKDVEYISKSGLEVMLDYTFRGGGGGRKSDGGCRKWLGIPKAKDIRERGRRFLLDRVSRSKH